MHLTETCDEQTPHIITHVETVAASTTDEAALAPIHAALAERDLLPSEHLADAGYVDAARVVESNEQQVRLIGPLAADHSWQAKAGRGYAAADFKIDWAAQQLTCPTGQQSVAWREGQTGFGQPLIRVHFAAASCTQRGVRQHCTRNMRSGRVVAIAPQVRHEALQAGRQEQEGEAF